MERNKTDRMKDAVRPAGKEVRSVLPYKDMEWPVHVIAWGILCSIPLLMALANRSQVDISWDFYVRTLIMDVSIIIVFYVNYLYLVKRFLFTRKTGWFILGNIGLIIVAMFLVHFFMEMLPKFPERIPETRRPPKEVLHFRFFIGNSLMYIFIVALSVAFRSTTGWYKIEAERRELERSRSEAELQNLKSQLNPHFLFNTLNNIYSLIAFSPEKAQDTVHELSRLLRYVMYDSTYETVTLGKELDFVRNYIELMRIRLPEHVVLDASVSSEVPENQVAPLLFISLIENAFKHGVSNNKPSFIYIDIYQEGNKVVCDILNSDFPKNAENDKSGSGIGLANLRKRLSLLYPDNHTLYCGKEGENFRSHLSFTVNDAV